MALARNLSNVLPVFFLVLNTHLLPTMFRPICLLTMSKVLFFFSAIISSFMAEVNSFLSEQFTAW